VESRQLIEMIDASTLPDGAEVGESAEPFVPAQFPQAAPVFGFQNVESLRDQSRIYFLISKALWIGNFLRPTFYAKCSK
jgi:hypothetical protein